MVVWKYDVSGSAQSVGWAVVVNNIEALHVLLNVDYFLASGLAGAGTLMRALASHVILEWTGLVRNNKSESVFLANKIPGQAD